MKFKRPICKQNEAVLLSGSTNLLTSERKKKRPYERDSQRTFVTNKLPTLKKMSPKLYNECFIQPTIQYFLATLCDLEVEPENKSRLGLRYSQTPEVRRLLSRLQKEKSVSIRLCKVSPNAVVSALKEILTGFPGGVFVDVSDEFYSISLHTPLEITLVYLHGLLETLPYFLRQFVYLICRSLRNLVLQSSGNITDSYTDLLLLFTPALFPSSVGDLERFLRAARLTLVMVDRCEQVFQPVVWLDHNANVWRPLSDDEAFFHQILASLQRLEASLDESESDSESYLSNNNDETDVPEFESEIKLPIEPKFYQFTYLDSM